MGAKFVPSSSSNGKYYSNVCSNIKMLNLLENLNWIKSFRDKFPKINRFIVRWRVCKWDHVLLIAQIVMWFFYVWNFRWAKLRAGKRSLVGRTWTTSGRYLHKWPRPVSIISPTLRKVTGPSAFSAMSALSAGNLRMSHGDSLWSLFCIFQWKRPLKLRQHFIEF